MTLQRRCHSGRHCFWTGAGEVRVHLNCRKLDFGKRRKTRYLLTEEEARARLKDPEKIEHTLEVRMPTDGNTIGFLKCS